MSVLDYKRKVYFELITEKIAESLYTFGKNWFFASLLLVFKNWIFASLLLVFKIWFVYM